MVMLETPVGYVKLRSINNQTLICQRVRLGAYKTLTNMSQIRLTVQVYAKYE